MDVLVYQLNQKKNIIVNILPQITQLQTVSPQPRPDSVIGILFYGDAHTFLHKYERAHVGLSISCPMDVEPLKPAEK